MRTEEQLKLLYEKFENDVKTKSRTFRFMIAIDQVFGVLFWNNSQDETISSKIGRLEKEGKASWFDKKICCLLNKLEYNHCHKSVGE